MRKIFYYLILVVIVVLALVASISIMMAVGFDGKWVSAFTAGICLPIIYGRKKIFLFLDRIFKVDK